VGPAAEPSSGFNFGVRLIKMCLNETCSQVRSYSEWPKTRTCFVVIVFKLSVEQISLRSTLMILI